MLGDLITRILVMVFGYVYPAFECYRVVENNRVEIQELRFWCHYWILVAILSVLERVGDTFVSWLPMYGELKLALFIYLWYPNTKGTDYVYDAILRPYVIKHEIDIDKKLLDWRARAWDLALFYWKNCTDLGQSAFFQIVHYLANQSSRSVHNNASDQTGNEQQRNRQSANRSVTETPAKSKIVKVEPPHNESTEYVHIDELASILADSTGPTSSSPEQPNNIAQKLSQARQRLRRFNPMN